MTKPIPDKAEIALEYPDKLYVGTFERSSRFEAHLDPTGIALILERPGADDVRKSIHMHINFGLFADIVRELARIIHKRWPDRRGTRMNTNFSNSDRKDALRGTEFPANPKNLYRHWTSRRSVAEP